MPESVLLRGMPNCVSSWIFLFAEILRFQSFPQPLEMVEVEVQPNLRSV